jgi:hypothetical protein
MQKRNPTPGQKEGNRSMMMMMMMMIVILTTQTGMEK